MNNSQHIYLDYAATTPVDQRVLKAMQPYYSESFGNASSIHSFGRAAKIALEESRGSVAQALGVDANEVFFTSGGTEADNAALVGAAFAARRKSGKNHIVSSSIEHHAVLDTLAYLQSLGFSATLISVDAEGRVDPDAVREAISDHTCLVSIMHGNNEIGTIQPLAEISKLVHERNLMLHSDTVQSYGKVDIRIQDLGIDILALSAHKIYGPKGIGVLVIRKGADLDSLIHGGGQERNRRAGTENIPLAVGCAEAILLAHANQTKYELHLKHLRESMLRLISSNFTSAVVNGPRSGGLPHILNISFDSRKDDIDGEALMMSLDLEGIAVSSGSACSSGSMEVSHVLQAIGRDRKTAAATVRFSFGWSTTEEHLQKAVGALQKVVGRLKK